MMDFNSWLFMLSFFGLVGVTIYKIYKLVKVVNDKEPQGNSLVTSWVFFITNLFLWVFCLVVVMVDTSILTFSVLFNVANLMLAINVLLLIIAHLVAFKIIGQANMPTVYSKGNRFMRRF